MDEDLFVGTKINWVADRVRSIADFKPRHIQRVCSFTYFVDPRINDKYIDVMGTFEGFNGNEILVSGEGYGWSQTADFKIYRKALV